MINEEFVQVGTVSLRDPVTNEPLTGVPVYIRETDYAGGGDRRIGDIGGGMLDIYRDAANNLGLR